MSLSLPDLQHDLPEVVLTFDFVTFTGSILNHSSLCTTLNINLIHTTKRQKWIGTLLHVEMFGNKSRTALECS